MENDFGILSDGMTAYFTLSFDPSILVNFLVNPFAVDPELLPHVFFYCQSFNLISPFFMSPPKPNRR